MDTKFQRYFNDFKEVRNPRPDRSRPVQRQDVMRPRRMSSAEVGRTRSTNYATAIEHLLRQRMIKANRRQEQISKISIGMKIVAEERKYLPV